MSGDSFQIFTCNPAPVQLAQPCSQSISWTNDRGFKKPLSRPNNNKRSRPLPFEVATRGRSSSSAHIRSKTESSLFSPNSARSKRAKMTKPGIAPFKFAIPDENQSPNQPSSQPVPVPKLHFQKLHFGNNNSNHNRGAPYPQGSLLSFSGPIMRPSDEPESALSNDFLKLKLSSSPEMHKATRANTDLAAVGQTLFEAQFKAVLFSFLANARVVSYCPVAG